MKGDDAQSYINRAFAYNKLEEYQKAADDYTAALGLQENEVLYCNRGNCYVKLERYDEAMADYNKSIELNAEYADAYYNRGELNQILKDYAAAMADYNKAAELEQQRETEGSESAAS